MDFIIELKHRNEWLFYFGVANLILTALFAALSFITNIQVAGVNAWHKPIKFALSIGVYAFTMGWLMYYLPQSRSTTVCSGLIVVMLTFEIVYIGLQAGRGQLSHFNISSPLYSHLYMGMAIAATIVSLITLYIGVLFFQSDLPHLSKHYVWAIRFGLLLFVIFSLEGFVMGANLSHTIGGPDGGKGLYFLNWSRKFGDPRVAHFIGMHALQVLPILAYYVLKNTRLTIVVAILYTLLALYVLIQALQAKPFLKFIN
ncbi:hypothetical protein [Microscilla marina]|uniref:Membrane protein, putative n=1 Tax=Microscilla marina ATCC 23134 TaxID=313606 RepID=A2A0I3_MICM2|nr:hypothetical protein [Microscilla marina]EAY23855.1 membrane protein, putative [Microscilla marina ATCC 23134]